MEEKQNVNDKSEDEKFTVDTENLKNETKETAKKVKESIKDAKLKEETKATKNFILDMIKGPLEKIKDVASNEKGEFFKTAIFLIIIWTIAVFIKSTYSTISYCGFTRIFSNILDVLKTIIAPILGVLVYSLIVLIYNNKSKKTLTTVISTVTITKLPIIIASVVSLLTMFSTKISAITVPFSSLCSTISIVLGFFGFKYLFNEECKEFIKKYVWIQIMYYAFYIIIGLLEIYI